MIPFNHLGWMFKTFGPAIYPKSIRVTLCEFIKPLSLHASVLDVGGGTGVMSELAHHCRNDLDFTVVDPAEGMLKHTKKYVKTSKAKAESLPFDDNSFDMVMMGEALHHFRVIDESMKETVRVLKKGGMLFIYDFDVSTFRGQSICTFEKLLGEPGNFFEPEALVVLLEEYGFSVGFKQHGWRYTIHANLM
jgi:ubiquinone/menaquinone biosynthesis C-methylase UbiE